MKTLLRCLFLALFAAFGCGGEILTTYSDDAEVPCCLQTREAGWACANGATDPWSGAACYWFAGGCFEACK